MAVTFYTDESEFSPPPLVAGGPFLRAFQAFLTNGVPRGHRVHEMDNEWNNFFALSFAGIVGIVVGDMPDPLGRDIHKAKIRLIDRDEPVEVSFGSRTPDQDIPDVQFSKWLEDPNAAKPYVAGWHQGQSFCFDCRSISSIEIIVPAFR